MLKGPQPHQYLECLIPYQNNKAKVDNEAGKIRLCYNEGAFGPSPKAMAAAHEAVARIHIYPDMGHACLRAALAARYKLDPARISCGAGSDDLIGLLARAYASKGDEVLYSEYGFTMFPVAAKIVGAIPVTAPEKDMRADVGALLKAVTPKTRILFLANPNNPTGSWLKREEINELLRHLREDILFVYDAAYADYMDEDGYSDGLEWAGENSRTVALRTFSKIHGLASLRIGWGYASHKVTEALNRIRNPFNISGPAEVAAIASLQDVDFIAACRAHTLIWREKLYNELVALGFKAYPSKGNFVMSQLESEAEAGKLKKYLSENGILVRSMISYNLPDCLRYSVGREEEMKALFAVLRNYQSVKNARQKATI